MEWIPPRARITGTRSTQPGKRPQPGAGASVLLLAASLVSVWGCSESRSPAAAEESSRQFAPAVRLVSVIQEERAQTTTQPATVHPFYRAEIRSRVTGYVSEVTREIGDFVEAGSVLAKVDVPEREQRLAVIEAQIVEGQALEKHAETQVQLAEAAVESAKAALSQSRSSEQSARAALAAAEAEFNRTKDLVDRQSLESRMLDEVRKKLDTERARVEGARSAIVSAEAEVRVAEAGHAASRAAVESAKARTDIARAELAEARVLVSYATIRAPFSGIVTQRHIEPGALVRQDSDVGTGSSLFVVSQVDKVRVHIPVPEVEAPSVAVGDSVTLTFPSHAAEPAVEAEVTRVSGALDPMTRTMLVEVVLANPDLKLLPGMFGEAHIASAATKQAKMLPARAVRFSESGDAWVYLVDDRQRVSIQPVETGIDDGTLIEVQGPLEQGQKVVDAHLRRLAEGQQVRVIDR